MNGARSLWRVLARDLRGAVDRVDTRRLAWSVGARLLPEFSFPRVRTALLRWSGADVRRDATFLGYAWFVGPPGALANLRIGAECVIGPGVTFGLDGPIEIGRGVSISPEAMLFTATHALGPASRRMLTPARARPIVVEDGVWIGMRALILPGVRLGRGCVVAAGSVVTENIPPNTLVSGNPAAVVRTLPLPDR